MRVGMLAVCVLVASCGRLRFDELGDAGATLDTVTDALDLGVFVPVVLPPGGNTTEIALGLAPGELYVGASGRGTFRTLDGGSTWTECALAVPDAIAVAPDGRVFLAVAGGDVLVSDDRCTTWQSTGGTPSRQLATVGTEVYAATVSGLRRFDGTTWSVVNTPFEGQLLRSVTVRGSTILIGSETSGVARSIDNGMTWTLSNTGLVNLEVVSIQISPSQPSRVYLVEGSNTISTGGLYRSDDNGQTWVQYYANGGSNVAIDPVNPDHVLFCEFTQLQSTTNGASFGPLSSPAMEKTHSRRALFDGAGGTYLTTDRGVFYRAGVAPFEARHGNLNVWRLPRATTSTARDIVMLSSVGGALRSTDGGRQFSLISTDFGIASDINDVLILGAAPNVMYAGSRFISVSTDSGATFTTIFDSGAVNDYAVNALAESGSRLVAVTNTQVLYLDPPGSSWTEVVVGSQYQNCFDLTLLGAGRIAVACTSGIYESVDNAVSFTAIPGAPTGSRALATLDDGSLLAAAATGVVRYSAGAWQTAGLATSSVNDLLVVGSTWVAAADDGVHVTRDAGASWTRLPGLVGPRALSLARDSDGNLLVGTYGYGLFRAPVP